MAIDYKTSPNKMNQVHMIHGELEAVGPRSYVQPTVLAQNNPAGVGGLSKKAGTNLSSPSVNLNSGTDN